MRDTTIKNLLIRGAVICTTVFGSLIGASSVASAAPTSAQSSSVISVQSAPANGLHRLFGTNGCGRLEGSWWQVNANTIKVSFTLTAKGLRGGSKATFKIKRSYWSGPMLTSQESEHSTPIFNKRGSYENTFSVGRSPSVMISDIEFIKGGWGNCRGPIVGPVS